MLLFFVSDINEINKIKNCYRYAKQNSKRRQNLILTYKTYIVSLADDVFLRKYL